MGGTSSWVQGKSGVLGNFVSVYGDGRDEEDERDRGDLEGGLSRNEEEEGPGALFTKIPLIPFSFLFFVVSSLLNNQHHQPNLVLHTLNPNR